MIGLFNELINGFRYFVQTYVSRLTFANGVSYGMLIIAIAVIGLVIYFLFRRLR